MPFISLLVGAFGALWERPFRTFLSMLGIMIGVAAVFVSLSIGEASKDKIRKNLDSVSARTMSLYPNWTGRSSRQRPWRPFTESDLMEIQALNGVDVATGEIQRQFTVVSDMSDWNANVYGVDTSYLVANELEIELGVPISDLDIEQNANVALIGSSASNSLFPGQNPVGQSVKIKDSRFRIIGLVGKSERESWGGRDRNNFVLVPRSTGRDRLFGESNLVREQVTSIIIVGETQDQLKPIEKDVELILRKSRGLSPDEAPDFRVFNFSANRQAAASIMQTINLIVLLMGGVSLVVGGVGVMNIMLASVSERTREIGLRKALGARRSDILSQILTEAILLALISGIVGLIGGYFVSEMLAESDNIEVKYTSTVMALAFGASFITGIISGLIPAWNASSLNPVEALQSD